MSPIDFDLVVVGSGFGGSLLSMIARRLGLSVLLLERGTHPRFAIGESTSPMANLLLEQMAQRYDLPRLLPLTAFGPWRRTYPQIGCGLKRGFTYFHHTAGRPYCAGADRQNQLLVAASPHDEVADTHWLRSDVDHFFVREAVALGVDYRDETALTGAQWDAAGTATLQAERQGQQQFRVRARLVVDATGPRGFLSRALNLPETTFAAYPATQTLYSHFTGVRRCDEMDAFRPDGGTPPYPVDDAALHHVFDGGWMWVLRFGNGVTSAGIAVTDALSRELGLSEGGAAAWGRFLSRFPSIGEQFREAEALRPFVFAPRLAYRCGGPVAGTGWALLPSAAAFVDPLFSTGIPLTLLGIERLGRVLEEAWGSPRLLTARLQEYSDTTLAEADWVAQFIAACYASFAAFPWFSAFSMFYFAAASYGEIARRIGTAPSGGRFLAADHPAFSAGLRRCAAKLVSESPPPALDCSSGADAFSRQVAASVAPINIAGLCDPSKKNWYGVNLGDLVTGASKLGVTPEHMRQILDTARWAQ